MKNNAIMTTNQFIMVNYKQRTLIPIDNIIMIEGQSNYSIFHLKHGKRRIYAHPIRYFEPPLLAQKFIRVHRGFLVNPVFVLKYDKLESTLNLHNSLKATISRRKLVNLPTSFLD